MITESIEIKRVPLWCQCKDCLETFTLDGAANNGHIIQLEEHPRIGRRENGDYYHRCGGNGHAEGRLAIFLTRWSWRF